MLRNREAEEDKVSIPTKVITADLRGGLNPLYKTVPLQEEMQNADKKHLCVVFVLKPQTQGICTTFGLTLESCFRKTISRSRHGKTTLSYQISEAKSSKSLMPHSERWMHHGQKLHESVICFHLVVNLILQMKNPLTGICHRKNAPTGGSVPLQVIVLSARRIQALYSTRLYISALHGYF